MIDSTFRVLFELLCLELCDLASMLLVRSPTHLHLLTHIVAVMFNVAQVVDHSTVFWTSYESFMAEVRIQLYFVCRNQHTFLAISTFTLGGYLQTCC